MNEIDCRIDLRALRALVAIADGGSFRAAADRLGYLQSAISTGSPPSSAASGRPSPAPAGAAR